MKIFVSAAATLLACTGSALAEESLGGQLTALISGIAHLYWPPVNTGYPLPDPSDEPPCICTGGIDVCPTPASSSADQVDTVDTGICPLPTSTSVDQSETEDSNFYTSLPPISTAVSHGNTAGTSSLLSYTQTPPAETEPKDESPATVYSTTTIAPVNHVWSTYGMQTVHDVIEKTINNIVHETAHNTIYDTVHETINNVVSVPHTVEMHDTIRETVNKVDTVPVTVPITTTAVQTSMIPVTSMISTTITAQGPTVIPIVTVMFPGQAPPSAGGAPDGAPGAPGSASASESPTSTTSLIPLQTRIKSYDYVGCFKYNATKNILKSGNEKQKDLPNGNMYFCSQECRLSRFVALSEGTQCFCGAEMQKGAVKVNNSECNTPCGNKLLETPCGGNKTVFGVYENVRGAPAQTTAYQKSNGVAVQPSAWFVSVLIATGAFLSGSVA